LALFQIAIRFECPQFIRSLFGRGCYNLDATGALPLIKPMLATAAKPFDHPDYVFEVKWDGYRCLAYLIATNTTLVSRNLKNITSHFPDLGDMHLQVQKDAVILDGEIIVLRDGQPSFDALQSRARLTDRQRINLATQNLPALYMAFDILYCRGKSLLDLPLYDRFEKLKAAVGPNRLIVVSDGVRGDGISFFRACADKGLEGVMAKRLDSRYLPGTRSPLWKKIRATREADLVICGYRSGQGSRRLGTLVMGAWNGKEFIYQGLVGTGIDRVAEEALLIKLAAISSRHKSLEAAELAGRSVHWVMPDMVCRVEYLALTGQGLLRHPVYRGLRSDKKPRECRPAGEQVKS